MAERRHFIASLADGTTVRGFLWRDITYVLDYPERDAWFAMNPLGLRMPSFWHNPLWGATINWEANRG